MRVSAQRASQRSRYACASSRVSKRSPLSGVLCVWPTADSTLPLRSGSRTRHGSATDAVVGEHVAVERIERRVVDVGREHALAQIVEDHDAARRRAGGTLSRAARPRSASWTRRSAAGPTCGCSRASGRTAACAGTCPSVGSRTIGPVAVVDLRFLAGRGDDHDARLVAALGRAACARSAARSRSRRGSRGRRPGPARSPSRCGRARRLLDQLAVRLAGAGRRRCGGGQLDGVAGQSR